MWLLLLTGGLVLIYSAVLEYLSARWQEIPAPVLPSRAQTESVFLSLVIVVRNECRNLPKLFQALQQQTISKKAFELHLVDDASTDTSWQLASAFRQQADFPVSLHTLQMPMAGGSPKKSAITQVVSHTRGEMIVVTDGDCEPASDWLAHLQEMWLQKAPVFISGPVRYVGEKNLFERLQALDFAALIGVGAALLQAGKPGMCNAANMAFSKAAFEEVGGYAGNEHIPSGDDEFLLQKLASRFPDRIHFMKIPAAIVDTKACESWQQFMHQRRRWAGKWRLHKGIASKLLPMALFLFYLLLAFALLMPFWYPEQGLFVIGIVGIKAMADYRFLRLIFNFLKKPLSLKVFLLLELVYPFYVLFFAVAANVGSFTWKERAYRYTTAAHERNGISSAR